MGSDMEGKKPIRLGVVGLKRGNSFMRAAEATGFKLVAVCDTLEERTRARSQEYGVTGYTNYDKFLEHDMDAVAVVNYFSEHAPLAIRALEAGKHVISETSACITMAEGVRLARTVEKTGKIYLFAENYPYSAANQEMKKLYDQGEIGELQYGEGEYIHPGTSETANRLAPGMGHWRNNIPATYYCTHSLAPIVYISGLRPLRVNALCIPFSDQDKEKLHVRRNDTASVILCRMENGAVARLVQVRLRGHSVACRLHGSRGMMEKMRYGQAGHLRVVHDEFDLLPGEEKVRTYAPDFPVMADAAREAGHGGGDFYTMYHFAEAIRTGEQPFLNVYRALDMTFAGIQGYRSALAEGAPFEIPDFRDETVRKRYENDDWCPLPGRRKPGGAWPSIRGEVIPSAEAIAYAESLWTGMEDIKVPYKP